jgi:hypothetical protein
MERSHRRQQELNKSLFRIREKIDRLKLMRNSQRLKRFKEMAKILARKEKLDKMSPFA